MASEAPIAALPDAVLLRVLQLAAAGDATALFRFPSVCRQWRAALGSAEDAFWGSCFHLCFGERIAFWSTVEQLPSSASPSCGPPQIPASPQPHFARLTGATHRSRPREARSAQFSAEDEIIQANSSGLQRWGLAGSAGEASVDAQESSSTWKQRLNERVVAGRGWEAGRRQENLVSTSALRRALQECGKLSAAEEELSRSEPFFISALKLECNLLFIALTGFSPDASQLSPIIVWDLERATHVSVCLGHTSLVHLLDVDRWCRFLLSSSFTGSEMCLWAVASGTCLARLDDEPDRPVPGLWGGSVDEELAVAHVLECLRWIDPDYSGVTQDDGSPRRLIPKDRKVMELTEWLASRRQRDALGERRACLNGEPRSVGSNECTTETSGLAGLSIRGVAQGGSQPAVASFSDVSPWGDAGVGTYGEGHALPSPTGEGEAALEGPDTGCPRCRGGLATGQDVGSAACCDALPVRQAEHGCSSRCADASRCTVSETLEWVTVDDSRSATLWRLHPGEERPVPVKRYPRVLSFDSRSGVLVVRGSSLAEVRLVEVRSGAELRSFSAPDAASRARVMAPIACPCAADLGATVSATQGLARGEERRERAPQLQGGNAMEHAPADLIALHPAAHALEQQVNVLDDPSRDPDMAMTLAPPSSGGATSRPLQEQVPAPEDPSIEEAYLTFSDNLGWGLLLVLESGEVVLMDADQGQPVSCIRCDPVTEACHTFSLLGRVSCVIHPLSSGEESAPPLGVWDLETVQYHSFDSVGIAGAWLPLHVDSLIAGRACATSVWLDKKGSCLLLWTEPGGHAPRLPMQCAYEELGSCFSDANWRWLVVQSSQGILASDFLVHA